MTIVCSISSIATAPASYPRKLWRLSATIRISSLSPRSMEFLFLSFQ